MNIVIAGAGEVGFHLAKLLADESQDITVIDTDERNLQYVSNHIDVMTNKGSASSLQVLKDSGVQDADLFVGLTGSEEVNITSCIISKKLGAKKTIARVSNTEYLDERGNFDLTDIGVDEIISPEALASKEIKRLLKESVVTDKFEFDEGKLSVLGLYLGEKSMIINKSLKECTNFIDGGDFITVAIHRQRQTIIPRGDTVFQPGDHVFFICKENSVEKILSLSDKQKLRIKDVMILAGSKTGFQIAKAICDDYKVKLIENNNNLCFDLANKLDKALIINGDAHNVDLLKEEGLSQMDVIISVTGNSETNIITSLVAKNLGVKKTIALVENMDYIDLSMDIGVDTLIDKKLIAANFIFRHIRQGDVISMTGLHGVNAEVLEFEVKPETMVTMASIKDLSFPKGAIIGGVVRDGEGHITMGNFRIQEGDHVVVFSLPECIRKVEDFFK